MSRFFALIAVLCMAFMSSCSTCSTCSAQACMPSSGKIHWKKYLWSDRTTMTCGFNPVTRKQYAIIQEPVGKIGYRSFYIDEFTGKPFPITGRVWYWESEAKQEAIDADYEIHCSRAGKNEGCR